MNMLRNRLPEVEIPDENPFQYDKLKREPCANTFLSILRMYSATGCVVALTGVWGSGKTTFIKMLMQKMKIPSNSERFSERTSLYANIKR